MVWDPRVLLMRAADGWTAKDEAVLPQPQGSRLALAEVNEVSSVAKPNGRTDGAIAPVQGVEGTERREAPAGACITD